MMEDSDKIDLLYWLKEMQFEPYYIMRVMCNIEHGYPIGRSMEIANKEFTEELKKLK